MTMQDRYDDANAGDPVLLRPCNVNTTADLLQWNLSLSKWLFYSEVDGPCRGLFSVDADFLCLSLMWSALDVGCR